MTEKGEAILAAILGLPENERWEVIDSLLERDAPPDNYAGMTDEEFRAEMVRRCEESRNGTDPGIPADEVHRILLDDIENARRQHRP